jgi:hypothetical protein
MSWQAVQLMGSATFFWSTSWSACLFDVIIVNNSINPHIASEWNISLLEDRNPCVGPIENVVYEIAGIYAFNPRHLFMLA